MAEKSKNKKLKEKLFSAKKNGYDRIDGKTVAEMDAYCAGYKAYLDAGKTERLCAAESIRLAEAAGYRPYERGMSLAAGDKVYVCNRGKAVMLAHLGTETLDKGAAIVAAHIDSPRLDLKPAPLYEEAEMAFFKTHYYGGVRKYQWTAILLELRGVVIKRDGTAVQVNIGAEKDDPKLIITDLLPHLGADHNRKPIGEAIPAESLNLLVGSRPVEDDEGGDRVKLAVMQLLNEKYGITEDDFLSAELEAVPAANACDIGLDRSLIASYGHDDRVCGYAALKALLDLEETPNRTAVCVLADKEEIGSMGVTGMQSAVFDTFMEDLCDAQEVHLRTCYENSFCLSADVTAAYDPDFAEVYEKRNAAFVNYGIALSKYTGHRGKSGGSDASAETVAYVRGILDDAGIIWQMAELGKTDVGGGGTVAMFMANRNIATLDAGVAVLSMHAPVEVVSKLDCYETYKAAKAIYQA